MLEQAISEQAAEPTLAELADAQEMSPHHFQRIFKAATGITPKQYARAHKARQMRSQLRAGKPVTDAIYQAGYGSSSRFYEKAHDVLGMKARSYSKGGDKQLIRWSVAKSTFGLVLVAATRSGVCAILFGENRKGLAADLAERFPNATLQRAESGSDFSEWVTTTLAYIEAPHGRFRLPLDVAGTAFQQRVWDALRDVGAGETTTYADVARRIGQPTAARAVAGACAANPVAVAIPCHRVLRGDGSLSGYRWGPERKQALLDLEASQRSKE
jgi:AraC family transcriptional regulator of adaptative response/methylated-DNA-[protein]-cysteine methyltransferase